MNEFYMLTGKEIKNVKFLNFVSKQYIATTVMEPLNLDNEI